MLDLEAFRRFETCIWAKECNFELSSHMCTHGFLDRSSHLKEKKRLDDTYLHELNYDSTVYGSSA
eukprot:2064473-Pleurochrysis_carterae.AAC.1